MRCSCRGRGWRWQSITPVGPSHERVKRLRARCSCPDGDRWELDVVMGRDVEVPMIAFTADTDKEASAHWLRAFKGRRRENHRDDDQE